MAVYTNTAYTPNTVYKNTAYTPNVRILPAVEEFSQRRGPYEYYSVDLVFFLKKYYAYPDTVLLVVCPFGGMSHDQPSPTWQFLSRARGRQIL